MVFVSFQSRAAGRHRRLPALVCAALLASGGVTVLAQQPAEQEAAAEAAPALSPDQLDSLVAPIALYPDSLLAQVLVASTYPLELIQLQQWLAKNPGLEGEALAEAVATQPWDPAIQSMAAVPDAVKRLADDIQWTTDLGNAFLAQQGDVMDAVQRMRRKAQDNGALESNQQQVVQTQVIEEKTVIVVESADPEVIYVPSYNPTYVYPPPVYPYPPVYYPPYTPGAAFVTFSFGVMWGAAWGGSCCGCGWGGNDIDINIDNNFNRINNIQGGNRVDARSGTWQHDPQHRGGAPYADRATASRYGGSARGDAPTARQTGARQTGARQQPAARPSGGGARPTTPTAGGRGGAGASAGTRPSTPTAGALGGAGTSPGGDRIGSRSIPSSGRSSSPSAFGGGAGGFNGSSARAASSRGASSMGSRGFSGSRGGGGGRRR
ncbi:MAG: DUF3300 domain-containing protein [Thermoanaerobaculales bacterium]|jgi:hypothetical protein|nr:DUF3300 domain-containing protein [Thermoanaerobaculales bacterium]